MSRLYGAMQRAALFLGLAALLVVVTGFIAWWALGALGFHLSLQAVLLIVGLGVVAIAMTSGGRTSPQVAPPSVPAARRSLTRAEIEALVVLHREGVITSDQLKGSLGALVPPGAPTPSADQIPGRRRP